MKLDFLNQNNARLSCRLKWTSWDLKTREATDVHSSSSSWLVMLPNLLLSLAVNPIWIHSMKYLWFHREQWSNHKATWTKKLLWQDSGAAPQLLGVWLKTVVAKPQGQASARLHLHMLDLTGASATPRAPEEHCARPTPSDPECDSLEKSLTTYWNVELTQVWDALAFRWPFCLSFGNTVQGNSIHRLYRTVFFEVCRFAARRRTEASEGGSWQLHNSDGWRAPERPPERAQVVLAHSPSNSAAGTRKLYRLYHQDTSNLFCWRLRCIGFFFFVQRDFMTVFRLILLTGEEHFNFGFVFAGLF